jgi:predicted  nucleic acid-binding Zn-ribbon protein
VGGAGIPETRLITSSIFCTTCTEIRIEETAMASGRRELTWQACDALAAAGRKPSIGSVREWTLANNGRKQGSDTDTQADINAWYALLLTARHEQQTIAGLPEDVAALARSLWRKANEAAAEHLAERRRAIDAELERARAETAAAIEAAAAAHRHAAATGHELDVARESIRRLEDALSTLRASSEATEARHRDQLQHRDEQITALRRDATRKEGEWATRLAELDGLRRHALLQIDEARSESRRWRGECERTAQSHQLQLDAERRAGDDARSALAGVTGRLSAIEEALAAALERNATLEAALARAVIAGPASRSRHARPDPGDTKRAGPAAFKRRKL